MHITISFKSIFMFSIVFLIKVRQLAILGFVYFSKFYCKYKAIELTALYKIISK